jgi:hypothetical protein
VVGLTATVILGITTWATTRMLVHADVVPVAFTADDGARAQQKIFEFVRRSQRAADLVLTEAEVNAFVVRHVDPRDLPFGEPTIRLLGDDVVEIAGSVPLPTMLDGTLLGPLVRQLPVRWRDWPIWVTVAARARLEAGRRPALRLQPRKLVIGRQRIPAFTFRFLFDPATLRFTRISLPADASAVRIDRGRLIIQATSGRGRP